MYISLYAETQICEMLGLMCRFRNFAGMRYSHCGNNNIIILFSLFNNPVDRPQPAKGECPGLGQVLHWDSGGTEVVSICYRVWRHLGNVFHVAIAHTSYPALKKTFYRDIANLNFRPKKYFFTQAVSTTAFNV